MGEGLKQRHALVTGGGRGIGRAIAVALAKAGARVSILGRDEASLRAAVADGAAHDFMQVDVTNEAETLAAIEKLGRAQPIDIVIANAGGAETAPFKRADADHFRRMFELNVIGTITPFRAVLPDMMERGSGRLIAIASTAGQRGYPYASAYSAAKHAVIGIVKSLALEVAKSGVTVNAICPGYADTDMLNAGAKGIAAKAGISLGDAKARFANDNPMGRLIQPEEVAAAVLFLCQQEAASINGQSLLINGGEF
jgi:NAD(P)-dependent dehydrogenase (short-subunit alcohol dehydrogenase family)